MRPQPLWRQKSESPGGALRNLRSALCLRGQATFIILSKQQDETDHRPNVKSLDLDTLKRYSRGELSHKTFMAVHQDAGELLDLLFQNLGKSEQVASIQDWPLPRRQKRLGQYVVLKTMMLFTPFCLIVGAALANQRPVLGFSVMLGWLGLCLVGGGYLLWDRYRVLNSKEGKSVLVVTNRRLMRIWLDGSETVQAWWLTDDPNKKKRIEPVSDTVSLLLELDMGKPSSN